MEVLSIVQIHVVKTLSNNYIIAKDGEYIVYIVFDCGERKLLRRLGAES